MEATGTVVSRPKRGRWGAEQKLAVLDPVGNLSLGGSAVLGGGLTALGSIVLPSGGLAAGTNITAGGNISATGHLSSHGLHVGVSDVAEMMGTVEALPEGTVVKVDPDRDGYVVACRTPRDPDAFGIVSSTTTALVLGVGRGGVPVAVAGRVWAGASTKNGPILRSKRLTPDGEGGLKAADDTTPPEAILGRALTELKSGTGMVEVLLTGR